MKTELQPGTIVRCRNRDWVLLPPDRQGILCLRPLTGATDNVVQIHSGLAEVLQSSLTHESVRSTTFPIPSAEDVSDAVGSHLLWQAARLTLREGAAPLRSLGRISIRPRVYQFVPLLMALRLDPVRLLVADDVGVGKTIESLLIARELLDRGEIKRFCVLCPPHLCDAWQKELARKFNLDAVVVRSGTVGQLERRKAPSESIYRYYPVQVASIDFIKTDRNKHLFLLDCPELVIVDEAHGCALPGVDGSSQHQRHELIRKIAEKTDRHLILTTATPHSGIADAFQSLLSLLRPEFGNWDTRSLTESQRVELARHFVQRTRTDIERHWESERCFPRREPLDETYRLSPKYRELFDKTYDFCSEIVRSGEGLDERRRRVRYWGALALLRCVMSSPASAEEALQKREPKQQAPDAHGNYGSSLCESDSEQADDTPPTPPIESAQATFSESETRRLSTLQQLARQIRGTDADSKIVRCAELVRKLLREGFHPIVWCRFIHTSDYVAEQLQRRLAGAYPDIRVISITGVIGEEERQKKVEELSDSRYRILVATDCLSEGVNLQAWFNAVIHYDLPWNPNRLEQREGRVDRYGQSAEVVKTIRFFSPDNPVDGVVLDVLLNKAREIHRALGTHVPVPEEGESVTQAVLNALFLRGQRSRQDGQQMMLDFGVPEVKSLHDRWDKDAERERVNRTRFAQRALKPEEVHRELEVVDAVLGDSNAVKDFVLGAAQRIGLRINQDKKPDVFRVAVGGNARSTLPEAVAADLPAVPGDEWLISFRSPEPEGSEYVGRNHRFVASLARHLLEEALAKPGQAAASRAGALRTRAVQRLTSVLLLRVRHLLQLPERNPLLSEEVLVTAFVGGHRAGTREWLSSDDALRLLVDAKPDANIPKAEKRELVDDALKVWPTLQPELRKLVQARAAELETSHKRVRQAVSLRVRDLKLVPQLPPDLLGILVLQPMVEGGRR